MLNIFFIILWISSSWKFISRINIILGVCHNDLVHNKLSDYPSIKTSRIIQIWKINIQIIYYAYIHLANLSILWVRHDIEYCLFCSFCLQCRRKWPIKMLFHWQESVNLTQSICYCHVLCRHQVHWYDRCFVYQIHSLSLDLLQSLRHCKSKLKRNHILIIEVYFLSVSK